MKRRGRDDPVPLADAVSAVGRDLGLPEPATVAALTVAWEAVVGAPARDHSRAVSLRRGVLTVAVDSAGWATQLRYRSAQILRGLATHLGTEVARELKIVVEGR